MRFGIEESDWAKIINVFVHFRNIERAILFGSRAKGTNKPFSDVDIALVGKDLSVDDLLDLTNETDDLLLPYEFDFCIYNNLKNPDLKSHIDRRGVEIYSNNAAYTTD